MMSEKLAQVVQLIKSGDKIAALPILKEYRASRTKQRKCLVMVIFMR